MSSTTKRCTGCEEIKPLDEYSPSRLGREGRASRCKVCKRAESKRCAEKRAAAPKSIPIQKQCGKCGTSKPAVEFARNKRSSDGLFAWCKGCWGEFNRQYHLRRAPELRARALDRYYADPQRQKENNLRRRDAIAGYQRHYHEANRDERLERAKARHRDRPDLTHDRVAKRRAIKKGVSIGVVRRKDVWERDGGICYYCKRPCDPKGWNLAHIIALSKGGPHTLENVAVSHEICNKRAGTN